MTTSPLGSAHWGGIRRNGGPRVLLVAVGCLVFGLVMAFFKGSTYNLPDVLGNLSAPWVLLAFWTSVLTSQGRVLRGVLIGTFFIEMAFLGFYIGESFVFHMATLPALRDGLIWSSTGLVAGPLFGALGSVESRSGRGRLWFVVLSLFILEPFVTAGFFDLTTGSAPLGHLELVAYGIEVALGILGFVFIARRFGFTLLAKR